MNKYERGLLISLMLRQKKFAEKCEKWVFSNHKPGDLVRLNPNLLK